MNIALLMACLGLLALLAMPMGALGLRPRSRVSRTSEPVLDRPPSPASGCNEEAINQPPIVLHASEWVSLLPEAMVYSRGSVYSTYETVHGVSGLVKVHSVSGAIEGNFTFDLGESYIADNNLVASNHSIFALGNEYLTELDAATLTVIHRLSAPTGNGMLLGANAAGTSLVWARFLGNEAVLLDAQTGNVTGKYTGGQKLQVTAGALHPTNGRLLVADASSLSLLLINPDNTVGYTSPYLHPHSFCLSLAVDDSGESAYGAFQPDDDIFCEPDHPFYYTLVHIDFSTGAIKARAELPCSYELANSLSATAASGELYFIDRVNGSVNLFSFATSAIDSSLFISPYPYNEWPAPLTTFPLRGLLVVGREAESTGFPGGFYFMNETTGKQVGEFVNMTPYVSACNFMTDVAATSRGLVYAVMCGDLIVVMRIFPNHTSEWVKAINVTAGTLIGALAVDELQSVLYYTDMHHPANITKCDLNGRIIGTLSGSSDDVFVDVAVDVLGDGSVWALQSESLAHSSIHHWAANGTLLSVWERSDDLLAIYRHLDIDWRHQQLVVLVQLPFVSLTEYGLLWLNMTTGQSLANLTFHTFDGAGGVAVSEGGRKVFSSLLQEKTVLSVDVA